MGAPGNGSQRYPECGRDATGRERACGADAIEEAIAEVVVKRIKSMKTMQGDDVRTLVEIEQMLRGRADGPSAAIGVPLLSNVGNPGRSATPA